MKQRFKRKSAVSVILFMLLTLFSSFSEMQAQEQITGLVKDDNGLAIPGVTIVQKGTTNGAITDFDGKYSLKLTLGAKTLIFSYLGYKTEEVQVGKKTTINIILEESVEGLDEVVIIGYLPVEREKILGAMATVKAASIEESTPIQAFDAIQGKVSGVQILTNNGPGEGFDVRIRGVATLEGDTSPLYVVDGQQLDDIDNIDPSDIETLEVLKEASTTAIYGARGANGVVLITTKSGKAGKLSLTASTVTGYRQLVGDLRLANTDERLLLDKRGNINALPNDARDSLNLLTRNSYNLQKLLTRPAVRSQTNVALSGGNDKVNFYWNTGYLSSGGIVLNSEYKRINSNLKLDVQAASWLDVGTNINFSVEDRTGASDGFALGSMVQRIPYYPLYEPDGSFTRTINGRSNPLAIATLIDNQRKDYRGRIFSYITAKITNNLSLKSTLGANLNLSKRRDFRPGILGNPNSPLGANTTNAETMPMVYQVQQENYLNYNNKWAGHKLGAFAGMQIQRRTFENSQFSSFQYINDRIITFNNAAAQTISSNSRNVKSNIYSLFTGFTYDYKGRYLIGGTVRRDGSSKFGKNNEFGVFPSASIGWNLTKEPFLKGNKLLNKFLIRASWGIVGNESGLSEYEFANSYDSSGVIYNGVSGVAPIALGNPDLSWESTTSTNLGVDIAMFKRRLEFNIDVWKKETNDLLAQVPLPEESGFASIRQNIGAMENRGVDVNINGTIIKSKDFTWESNFNFGYLENEVTKLARGIPFSPDGSFVFLEEGQPIGNFFGYKNLGVYQYDESNAYTDNGVRLTPNFDDLGSFLNYTLNGVEYTDNVNRIVVNGAVPGGGDIIWEDKDGNFAIDVNDRQILGNGLSNFFGGFSNTLKFKNFSMAFQFDFSFNHDIYRRWDELRNDFTANGTTPGPDRINGAWQNPGDITVYPNLARRPVNYPDRNIPNSFFITDGSYIKLRYVRFNYRLPQSVMGKMKGIKNIAFNLAINNVLTWTNYIGYNPEIGSRGLAIQPNLDTLRYPNDREILLGMRLQLN